MAERVGKSDKNANPLLSMFGGMPKIFWLGMAIMYGWCFLFMIIEMRVPGFPLKKILGIPACYIYNWMFALWIVNIIVSFLFFWFEEQRENAIEKKNN